ncbi:carbohydrate porin [Pseudoalteromonas sp. S16_S37]|uniref:carbohydrate porin n=1 Tax=Pseudoalteromonas sp. S16_S37 TaxID=2720228 RepID=UPI0016813314|nr:carbohydrate porin [Pseudoalteromonas sp. S16_S37]MBD1584295.1 carbohydrate porin [Pseudoalteromonas sp. S16_S37]
MKRANSWAVIFLMLMACNVSLQANAATLELDSMGYLRHGVLSATGNSASFACEHSDGAFAKPRFGNECEGFLELQFQASVQQGDYKLQGVVGWDFIDVANNKPELLYQDERYLQLEIQNGQTYWLGKRSYQRHEAHLYDYKYYHIKGEGVGFEVPHHSGMKAALAYFYRDEFGDDIKAFDLRFVIPLAPLSPNTTAEFIALKAHSDDEHSYSTTGLIFTTKLNHTLTNRTSIKRASGPFATHELARAKVNIEPVSQSEQYLNELVLDEDNWSLGLLALVERRKIAKTSGLNNHTRWQALGLRFIGYQNAHFSWVSDISHDRVTQSNGLHSRMSKISLAYQYAKNKGFYTRPVVRVFVSQLLGKNLQAQALSRTNFGVQFETWW